MNNNDTTHVAFFGDCKRKFAFTPALIAELERKCGVGIGGLCKRLFAGDFMQADIIETIRLGLIGAGTPPDLAAMYIETYAIGRPLNETYPIAVGILEALWFGAAKEAPETPETPEAPAHD